MHQPQPQTLAFQNLVVDVENGTTKIPQFQRDFVWTKDKTAKLIDSILKGYPVGTFIIWRTKERLRAVRDIGGLSLPPTPEGDAVNYVLDGQQRMTSIFAAIKGAVIERDGTKTNFRDLYVDLDATGEAPIVTLEAPSDAERYIRFIDLYKGDLTKLSKYGSRFAELQKYRDQITSYNFSTIVISNVGMDVATEIFTRINTNGQALSIFEIMVAKTYSETPPFDLSEAWKSLHETLSEVGFGTIPPTTLLQVVAAISTKESTGKAILSLDRTRFIAEWPMACSAVADAIDWMRSVLRIPVSDLIPFNALLVPLAYFFKNHSQMPTGEQAERLIDFFWRVSLGQRYSSGADAKIAQDLKKIDSILNNKLPTYDWGIDHSSDFIEENGYFSTGRSYIKALLCILAYQRPRSYISNADVMIRNEWLKRANSKNYHHVFPKSYLSRKDTNWFYVNHIANISIVDDFLNKREIGAKKPSIYFDEFARRNSAIDVAMKTHLIKLGPDGIADNDYDKFFNNRLKRFSTEIRKRLIPQAADEQGQAPLEDDIKDEDAEAQA